MLWPRVIPVLTLKARGSVKTMRFRDPLYLGDPVNALRIFNTKEVDEVIILDITASKEGRSPDLDFVKQLATECFMPVAFGGGIASLEMVEKVLEAGIEKVCLNTAALRTPQLVSEASREFGGQAIVAAIDYRRPRIGGPRVVDTGTPKHAATSLQPVTWAAQVADLGAGEILLTSIDRDGTAAGYDVEMIAAVAGAVTVPVIACGGAGSVSDLRASLDAGASAAAAGRLFVTHGRHRASLVSYLDRETIASLSS